jgi:F0F1-type ATP synthase membrane subunit b/b'
VNHGTRLVITHAGWQGWTLEPTTPEATMGFLDDAKAKADELARQAKPHLEQARVKADELAQQARVKADELAQQAKPHLDQAREKAGPLAQQARERAEKAAQSIRERTKPQPPA